MSNPEIKNKPNISGLTPWKPGQSGNPAGKPKGRRNLSTIIKDMLENPIDWETVPIKDKDSFQKKYKERAAWEALVEVAFSRALAGDTRAMNFLSKAGYGDKLVHDFEPGFFSKAKVEIEIVKPADAEAEAVGDAASSPDTTE